MILAVRAFCKALVSVAFGGRIGETARVSEELSAEHGEAVKRAELAEAHAAALAEEVERIRKWDCQVVCVNGVV
jgi:predicted  nucleic acid-binding Zn-ribbon protein